MNIAKTTTLELLRYGIGKLDLCQFPCCYIDWKDVFEFSRQQGIAAFVLDGLDRCILQGQKFDMDFQTKMEWIGEVQQMETIYSQHKRTISNLAKFYSLHNIKMMLLKGIGLSFDYPVSNHRPCGDIDIYLYGDLKMADDLLAKQYGIEINHDQHKHTMFQFEGLTIENHYDFANYYKHRSSRKLDEWLKEDANANLNLNANDDLGENVYLPSANFNAVFLVRHAASHFAAEVITLRHLLDWAFFVEKHYDEVDWEWQWKVCQEQNMHKFLLAINDICVNILGFDNSKYKTGGETALTEMVLNEIMYPSYIDNTPKGMMENIMKRGQLWWRNRWKHKIVYPESLLSTFFQQVYAHLMKPATMKG